MRTKRLVFKSTEETADILCDKCGNSVCINHGSFTVYECGTLYASWGYGSGQDGSEYHFDLCEPCFMDIIATFKNREPSN
jgi:hypothetical protein